MASLTGNHSSDPPVALVATTDESGEELIQEILAFRAALWRGALRRRSNGPERGR